MKYQLLETIPTTVENIIKALKSTIATTRAWSGCEYNVQASHGNVELIAENIYSFTEYNFLPIEGRRLDGHYEMYINTATFEFLIRRQSYYGGLTYTTPVKDEGWYKLNVFELYYIKALLASKLLGMYFYDRLAVNSNGRNLFSTGKHEHAGYGYSDSIMRWSDGVKRCLICDYKEYRDESNNAEGKLGHLTDINFEAIKILTQ
jgi:hypothetical protein